MKKKIVSIALSLAMAGAALPSAVTADSGLVVAFPGAEGAGKYATGGRGGKVYHVTNLNDSGTGSFRDAVSGSNRIVVFDVGGTIELKSDVVVKGNITVAGQTAPGGGGVTLCGGKIGMGGDNIIIRFVSSRPGENGASECDAWGGNKGSNSIIDHCSIGWANDEQFGLYSATQQTVQYSLIGPSNCISYHSKGAHGFGIMMGAGNNTWHHNMIAHNISRNYRGKIGGTNTLDYVNNVIFNWGYQTAYGTFGQVNYVGNYFKKGLSTNGGHRYISISSGTAPENYRFYLTGNKMVNSDGTDYNSAMNSNNWLGVDYGNAGYNQSHYQINSPVKVKDINGNDASVASTAQTADEAFETVLAYAGAGIRADLRPRIDRQVMEEARTGNGYLTGGRDFSTLTSSDTALNDAIKKYNIKEMDYDEYYPAQIKTKDITDSDNDGMSDEWEIARGLNPNKNDAMGDYLGHGYNNIEYYINDLTVDAFPKGVVELSPETADLGEEYTYAKEDMEAISISPTVISKASELSLPTKGTKHSSSITWSSASSAIVIKNNQITAVNRPSEGNVNVSLVATVTNGEYSVKKYFTVTVLSTAASWTASASDVGKTAGTELMTGLTTVSDITKGSSLDGNVIGGIAFNYYVSGDNNGSWTDGAATGTALKYTASEDGFLSGYITNLGENKSAFIIEEGAKNRDEDYTAMISGADGADQIITAKVSSGKTYYLFVAGSKGRFARVSFDTSAPIVMWKASAPVTAGAELMNNLTPAEDMAYMEKNNTNIDGIDFTGCISGTNNPKENGATGAALHYTAPADGTLTVYYKIGSGKTFKINDVSGNVVDSYTNEDEASEYTSTTVTVDGGTTYYIYVAGSKAEFYGVSYQQTGESVSTSTPEPGETTAPTAKPTATPVPTMAPQWWKASKTVTTGEVLMTGLTSAGELAYTEKASTADGVEFTGYVNGEVNGKYSDGVFSGNGVIFKAPEYGELKVYMEVGAGKTIKITDSENNSVAEWVNDGEKAQTSIKATVEKGKTYYAYVAGSRARIYGAYFEQKEAPEIVTSLTLNGSVCEGTIAEPDGCDVYIAQYDADGRLVAVTKSAAKAEFSAVVNVAENAASIKAMIWDDMEPYKEYFALR